MKIRLLVIDGCPNTGPTVAALQEVLAEASLPTDFETLVVDSNEMARRERFVGSPSIHIDGLDIEQARRADTPNTGCRTYESNDGNRGVPSRDLIAAALRRAGNEPLRVLFLCTGNSCRSQMAEGWTRALRGDVIETASAGIEKHGLNPNAVQIMAEAGVDISRHESKHVKELPDHDFDYVITVCGHAAETCPVIPGARNMVHMGFDDPPKLAQDATSEEEALAHYRRVRDEIRAFVENMPGNLEELARTSPILPKPM